MPSGEVARRPAFDLVGLPLEEVLPHPELVASIDISLLTDDVMMHRAAGDPDGIAAHWDAMYLANAAVTSQGTSSEEQ